VKNLLTYFSGWRKYKDIHSRPGCSQNRLNVEIDTPKMGMMNTYMDTRTNLYLHLKTQFQKLAQPASLGKFFQF